MIRDIMWFGSLIYGPRKHKYDVETWRIQRLSTAE